MKRREFLTVASVAGGAAAVAPSAAAAQSETPTSTGEGSSTATGNGTATPTGTAAESAGGFTRTVEMTDSNVYEPKSLEVLPGDTVVWENVGSVDHSVTAYESDLPEGADYWASGGFDSQDAATSAYVDGEGHVSGGETFEHTFETEGTHGYFCIPHEAGGMVGEIVVTEDAATPTPAASGGGEAQREVNPEHMGVPFQAHFVGLATGLMMVVSLVFTFYVLKYGESPNVQGGGD
jgi:plastocyanin